MRIRLAVLDEDVNYINRLAEVFHRKYSDSIEIYAFTNESSALENLGKNKADVFVANEKFEIDVQKLPVRCGFAYFVEKQGIESIYGQIAIAKFQKVELIYKQILSIYSEKAENLSGLKYSDASCKTVVFMSSSGGVGASTMAAACATSFAQKGKRVLYLNLETFGTADSFFSGEGQYDMSDMIYALKSKKANISIKLKSNVKQSVQGVFFFSKTKVALDMMEMKLEDKLQLISQIQLSGDYDYIILDLETTFNKETMELFKQAHEIIFVSDGSVISNEKLVRLLASINILDKNMDISIANRIMLMYNKFSNKTSQMITGEQIQMIGGAPRFEQATVSDIVEKLASMDLFDKLL